MANIDKTLNQASLFSELSSIIEQARTTAYRSVNAVLVQRNWLLGKCINEEVLNGSKAEYGKSIMQDLSQRLTETYGQGFDMSSLYKYARFNTYFPELVNNTILDTVSPKFNIRLSWITIALFCKKRTRMRAHGMRMRQPNRCGASARCNETYLPLTIIVCCLPNIRNRWRGK